VQSLFDSYQESSKAVEEELENELVKVRTRVPDSQGNLYYPLPLHASTTPPPFSLNRPLSRPYLRQAEGQNERLQKDLARSKEALEEMSSRVAGANTEVLSLTKDLTESRKRVALLEVAKRELEQTTDDLEQRVRVLEAQDERLRWGAVGSTHRKIFGLSPDYGEKMMTV
jgi:septal ring factor EnvC (AmiA/AmiB activator)